MSELAVDFAGEMYRLGVQRSLAFGRVAELEIDCNVLLPPVAGEFRFRNGVWWLSNLGTELVLEVHDRRSFSRMMVAPGTSVPLSFAESSVCFKAGAAVYAIDLTLKGGLLGGGFAGSTLGTKASSEVTLNDDQHLLLVALSEPMLRNAGAPSVRIPTNRAVADRLGWPMPKFNRKLDHLCLKFTRLGVLGLKGDQSSLAGNRRQILVDYVLSSEIISADDLEILEAYVHELGVPAVAALSVSPSKIKLVAEREATFS